MARGYSKPRPSPLSRQPKVPIRPVFSGVPPSGATAPTRSSFHATQGLFSNGRLLSSPRNASAIEKRGVLSTAGLDEERVGADACSQGLTRKIEAQKTARQAGQQSKTRSELTAHACGAAHCRPRPARREPIRSAGQRNGAMTGSFRAASRAARPIGGWGRSAGRDFFGSPKKRLGNGFVEAATFSLRIDSLLLV